MKEVMVYYTDKESIPVSYNRKVMLEKFKKYGEKSLGGFTIDDPIEQAYLFGARSATALIKTALDHLNDDKEEE